MRSRRSRRTKLRAWCEGLGQETFVGSSGRVFPKSLKASPLLRAWIRRLDAAGVVFRPRHRWTGWADDGALTFDTPAGVVTERADATVLALGGASWPRLGSDGSWAEIMTRAGIGIAPLRPANCRRARELVGDIPRPLRRRAAQADRAVAAGRTVRGEALVTRTGLEGGGIYALSAPIRDAIDAAGEAILHIDLRPDLTAKR